MALVVSSTASHPHPNTFSSISIRRRASTTLVCLPRSRVTVRCSASSVIKKTHITGAFCTKFQRAASSFTFSKLRSRSFIWHKNPSVLCVFYFQKNHPHKSVTLTPPKIRSLLCVFCVVLSKLRTRLLLSLVFLVFLVFLARVARVARVAGVARVMRTLPLS